MGMETLEHRKSPRPRTPIERLDEFVEREAGAEFCDDVVEVFFRAEPLALQYFDNRGNLPHARDSRFFDGHGFTLGTVVAHGMLSTDSCTSCVTQCSTRL